jgi:hypothetical protein
MEEVKSPNKFAVTPLFISVATIQLCLTVYFDGGNLGLFGPHLGFDPIGPTLNESIVVIVTRIFSAYLVADFTGSSVLGSIYLANPDLRLTNIGVSEVIPETMLVVYLN